MKLLWWKVYLWLNVALVVFAAIAEFSYPTAPPGLFIADVIIYSLALIGVYAFVFKKPIFTTEFWKYLFWFNVVYSVAFLLYAIDPNAPIINYVSNLSYGDEENLLLTTVIGILLSIPYMYAMYQLSKGYFLEPKAKENDASDNSKWGMIQTALWGYSIVFVTILILLSFIPSAASSGESGEFDFLYTTLIFAPILLFWLWIVSTYKQYIWNWWRITLVLNSVLFSGLIVFGTLFYDSSMPTATGDAEFDIIGVLQFLIIYAGLIVFGRDQFAKQSTVVKVAESKIK